MSENKEIFNKCEMASDFDIIPRMMSLTKIDKKIFKNLLTQSQNSNYEENCAQMLLVDNFKRDSDPHSNFQVSFQKKFREFS